MSSCVSCGAQLGVGRFCTNCGASVDSSTPDGTPVSTPVTPPPSGEDWRTDTAERKLPRTPVDPRTPPAATAPPTPPRYPLYADEVDGYTPYGPLSAGTEPAPPPAAAVEQPPPADVQPDHGYDYPYYVERRSPVLWILVSALALVLVAAGWWFLVRDDGSDRAADEAGSGPTAQGTQTSTEEGSDVAGRASAQAPVTAPPNQDVDGDQVSYDASNMLDGVPDTAWRAPGDATGMALTFTLREPTELSRVGLVNGYAKTSSDDKGRTFDWYLGNRRVNAVVWVFDDGSKVRQQLKEDRGMQTIDVGPFTTSRVVLRLVRVSKPGLGQAARDFTAVSELLLFGTPAG